MLQVVRRMDLQAKVSLVLVAVIVPTFLIVTVAQNQFTRPLIGDEIRQIGITAGKTLAAQIDSARLLSLPSPNSAVESTVQEMLYTQPNVMRIDVVARDPSTGTAKLITSSIEDDLSFPPAGYVITDAVTSDYRTDSQDGPSWDIVVPIEHRSRDARGPRRLLGAVHVVMSLSLVGQVIDALWKSTAAAAAFSVIALILALSYFLKRMIQNDRRLKQVESRNVALTAQLHDAERELMNTEKLAVMGQLTASFAHEIGTPLNAIGGHLQLLKEEVPSQGGVGERLDVINGQLSKIESIVKGFLQSTAKPASQTQLTDFNALVDKTLRIVAPRIDALGIDVRRKFDRAMGPLRVVPLDIEQILLNLVNNSLDSMSSKVSRSERAKLELEVSTRVGGESGRTWAEISVYDTGEGISKSDLKNVLKPFFTTKRPGEGTGLGLAICQQLAHKYGGGLVLDSKQGAWTQVTLRIPYEAER